MTDNSMVIIVSMLILFGIIGIIYKKKVSNVSFEDKVFNQFQKELNSYRITEISGDETEIEKLLIKIRNSASKLNAIPEYTNAAINLWRIAQESDRPLLVLVMGEFKTGKSTFINTLLGEDILKTDSAPATAVSSLIRYGDDKKVLLHYKDGSDGEYPYENLGEITAEGDDSKQELRDRLEYVEIFYPSDMLKKINLVDTPGLNVHNDRHIENTENFKSTADVVLWVLNAARSATRSEVAEIEALGKRLKPFAIVNRIDNIDEEEETVEEVLNNVRRRMGKYVQEVIGVSAKMAKEAIITDDEEKLQESGWKSFREKLDSHFILRSDELKEKSIIDKLNDFKDSLLAEFKSVEAEIQHKKDYFKDKDTAINELNTANNNIEEAIQVIIDLRKKHTELWDEFYKVTLKGSGYIDNTNELAEMYDRFLGIANGYRTFIEFLSNVQEAEAPLKSLEMLLNSVDNDEDKMHRWFNSYDGLCREAKSLESEEEKVSALHEDYMHSGLFGGEPIFDFSGRRENFNKAVEAYNKHVEEFKNNVNSLWSSYKNIGMGVNDKLKDINGVSRKLEKIMNKQLKEIALEVKKIEENFDKEKAFYDSRIANLKLGYEVLDELDDIAG